jgi:hypothetical protein
MKGNNLGKPRFYSRLGAYALGVILFVVALPADCADPQSSTDDLWDLSEGAVVTGSSAISGGFDARDIFGGVFGTIDDGQCIFLDNQAPDFVHYIEWQTPTDVTVGRFVLFAEGDGPASNNQREFAQFVLRAKSSPGAPDYDLTLFTYDVPDHPYAYVDPTNRIVLYTNFTPVTAASFRAEFVQRTTGGFFDAPRIWELDGYPMEPIVTIPPTNKTVAVQESFVMAVKAIGAPPLGYQWLFNGAILAGVTNATFAIDQVQFSHAGNYAVVVSDAFGGTNNAEAVLTVVPAPPCVPGPTNAISWWRAEGSALDQVSGNHGTLAGNTTFGLGQHGQGFVFDGNADSVSLGNPATLRSQDFTIEAWIQRASASIVTSSGSGTAVFFGYGFGGYGFGIYNDGRLYLTKVGLSNVTLTNGVTDTDWHHVAVTKVGSAVNFYIDGIVYPAPPYDPGFTFTTAAAIGARGDNQDASFMGMIDEPTFYSRALTASEIQMSFDAGSPGKCLDLVPPTIVSPPRNTNVVLGSNMTFNVVAGGSLPITYQWRFNGTDINGATNASLVVSNVQFASMGSYSVLVANNAGSVVSSAAALNVVFPPANIRVLATNSMAGGPIVVPIMLAANGNENSFGFSLNYSTQRLAYAGIALGNGATGANMFVNTSMTVTGRLGVAVVFPSQGAFAPGTQEVVRVMFNSLPLLGAQPANTTISFADQPVLRELSDSQLQSLSANYFSITLTLSPTVFESDVSPRTNGNQSVSVTDWLQTGRFVARLDPIANTNEFRRADSAPRGVFGDGQLKATDWVQAGRYLAGADPLVAVGGPTVEGSPTIAGPSANRRLIIVGTGIAPGQTTAALINLEAQGGENAVGFTVAFDPAVLMLSSVEPGNATVGANFLVNTSQAGSGKVGVLLALAPGSTFTAGTREMTKVNFVAATTTGTYPLLLTDQIVTRCVSDAAARELAVSFVGGNITVISADARPTLTIARSSNSVLVSWPAWAGDFTLQSAATLDAPSNIWSNTVGSLQTNSGEIRVSLPTTNQTQFFRLRR